MKVILDTDRVLAGAALLWVDGRRDGFSQWWEIREYVENWEKVLDAPIELRGVQVTGHGRYYKPGEKIRP
jgi:hypothetical protein